jgi:alpha-ribazole phosphatase
MTTFWLIRHPEPESGAAGLCYGSLDWNLSERGKLKARAIASALEQEPLAAIYTSPRLRCTQAAQILAAGYTCPVEALDALRELDFGAFEGRRYEEIERSHPTLYRQWMESPTDVQFPGGESFAAMRVRVLAATAALRSRHEDEKIALVTHGGVIRIILADALGMPPAHIFRLAQRYGAINLVRYFGGLPLVELVNADPLSG